MGTSIIGNSSNGSSITVKAAAAAWWLCQQASLLPAQSASQITFQQLRSCIYVSSSIWTQRQRDDVRNTGSIVRSMYASGGKEGGEVGGAAQEAEGYQLERGDDELQGDAWAGMRMMGREMK
jgi:hypothetical protein